VSGVILIVVLALWFYIAFGVSAFLGSKIRAGILKGLMRLVLFPLILLAPVADDIIGGFQFRSLCKAEAVATYDEAKVRGRTVHLKSAEVSHYANTILPTHKQIWRYADHITNEELLSYVDIHSDGGWLSRWISFSSVIHPYTFDGNCSPDNHSALVYKLNIKKVNKN